MAEFHAAVLYGGIQYNLILYYPLIQDAVETINGESAFCSEMDKFLNSVPLFLPNERQIDHRAPINY